LAFSYWIDNLGFITKGKLAAIFIKPSLGVSNWPVIYFINYTPTSSLAPYITAPPGSYADDTLIYIPYFVGPLYIHVLLSLLFLLLFLLSKT
jgi:hypothetical protein